MDLSSAVYFLHRIRLGDLTALEGPEEKIPERRGIRIPSFLPAALLSVFVYYSDSPQAESLKTQNLKKT